jgi:hypothetical protein
MEELKKSMPNVYAVIVAMGGVIKRIDSRLADGHPVIVNREYIIEKRVGAHCLIEWQQCVDPMALVEIGIACFDELPPILRDIYSKQSVECKSFSKYSQLDAWVNVCMLYAAHETFVLKSMILVFQYFAKLEALLVDDVSPMKSFNNDNLDTLIAQVKLLERRELWMRRRGLNCQPSALSTSTTLREMRYYPIGQLEIEDSKL